MFLFYRVSEHSSCHGMPRHIESFLCDKAAEHRDKIQETKCLCLYICSDCLLLNANFLDLEVIFHDVDVGPKCSWAKIPVLI
jgi:hypothetical protein